MLQFIWSRISFKHHVCTKSVMHSPASCLECVSWKSLIWSRTLLLSDDFLHDKTMHTLCLLFTEETKSEKIKERTKADFVTERGKSASFFSFCDVLERTCYLYMLIKNKKISLCHFSFQSSVELILARSPPPTQKMK